MRYNKFEFRVIFRVLLLSGFLFLGFYIWFTTAQYLIVFLLLTIVVNILINLLHLVRKSNRDIRHFLESVRNQDFSFQYSTGRSSNFPELHNEFNAVINQFRQAYGKSEEQVHYLQYLIQHVSIGLICLRSDGKVDLVNRSALTLLNVNSLKHFADLKERVPQFASAVGNTRPGQKSLVKMQIDIHQLQLLLRIKDFRIGNRLYTLISMENIEIELEEKEQKVWQDLIRVLMHEMMNSIAPITSLSDSISGILNKGSQQREADRKALQEAASTISRRGKHLMQFVKNYRQLTRLPEPDLELTALSELFNRIEPLYRKRATDKNVKFSFETDPQGLKAACDPALMEQVLINLLENAFTAIEETEDPEISVRAYLHAATIIIRVMDNGIGIPEGVREKIFIPFFTTRKNGNGIGLTLSKQIVRAHKGTIHMYPREDNGTDVRIHLRA